MFLRLDNDYIVNTSTIKSVTCMWCDDEQGGVIIFCFDNICDYRLNFKDKDLMDMTFEKICISTDAVKIL